MDSNHQVLNNSNSQPAFTEPLRHGKALISTMAVMGVTGHGTRRRPGGEPV